MTASYTAPSVTFIDHAERELAAFLAAAVDVVGRSGLPQAGETWIRTLESLGCPDPSPEQFCRRVTILATSRLVENSAAGHTKLYELVSRAVPNRIGTPLAEVA
jgi:hypothetical protein